MQLPELFIERMQSLLGDDFLKFEQALQQAPPVSVRINDKLNNYRPSDKQVPWCDTGYYLHERPLFTADPLLHAGVYYVQEASSMFLKYISHTFLQDAETVLDLCAAPGGKSTVLLESLSENTLLVANEIISSRANILAENLTKWGNSNIVVTNNAPKDFQAFPAAFDAIVVDAPCSGEGMFRKDPIAIQEWSMQNVQNCVNRQKDLLQNVWNSLKNNGLLIYSTCTYNREENEEQIAWLCDELDATYLNIDISSFPGIVETDYGYRFYPHKIEGEGLFIAVLRKGGVKHAHQSNKKKQSNRLKTKTFTDRWQDYHQGILHAENYQIIETNNQIRAIPKKHFDFCMDIQSKLRTILNGVLLAEIKGKDHIPAHQFALSKIINHQQFQLYEVDYQTAITFLKRENLQIPIVEKGSYVLITYQKQALGWVKYLGNRTNNLYPMPWRIRMSIG